MGSANFKFVAPAKKGEFLEELRRILEGTETFGELAKCIPKMAEIEQKMSGDSQFPGEWIRPGSAVLVQKFWS